MNQSDKLILSREFLLRNLANIVSIIGVLPLALLFLDNGFAYVIPLIIFNNFMDDLDGLVAKNLNIGSRFGANLDNVCDAVAHVILALMVGVHFGGLLIVLSMVAAGAIILRVTSRLDPKAPPGIGSPTNELMRHLLFVLLLTQQWGLEPTPFLALLFLLHSVSLLVPFKMPELLRALAQSPMTVAMINVLLMVAWLVPPATPVIAFSFIGTYLYASANGWATWNHQRRNAVGSSSDAAKSK